jgi:Protein of unknown function (DUF726)
MSDFPSSPELIERTGSQYSDVDSSSYTASLVQSAAKSVLEASTCRINDDDDGISIESDDGTARRRSRDNATLLSLQKETTPALPTEEDRKRFIGCLAAVLASSFEYDYSEGEGTENDHSAAYLEVYVREEEGFYTSGNTMSKDLIDGRAPIPKAEHIDISTSDDDESIFLDDKDDITIVQDCDEGTPSERSTKPSKGLLISGENNNRTHPRRTSSAMSLTQSNKLFQTARDAQMLQRALIRHRKRRYQVLSAVLLNAAKFLRLDPSQSQAFLPILARLLKPLKKSEHDQKQFNILGIDKDDFIWPFLESLTPGSGYRCMSMLLLEHLLRGEEGYDARVRRAYKKLTVLIILRDGEYHERSDCQNMTELEFAARKFEALEHGIASKILALSGGSTRKTKSLKKGTNDSGITREQLIRGLKIGSASLLAGTIFAVTGGLAAPGIAAGIAALAGSTAAAGAAIVALTSTAAVTTIFGVGGAGLYAYKMHRRQLGLTEFEFQKESGKSDSKVEAELFTTICISGWVRDPCDFQRPWGVQPSNPPIRDRLELLERFYAVFKPENVSRCEEILTRWQGHETKLWAIIQEKYGRDPSHLFPLEEGPRDCANLTVDQREVILNLFIELGYISPIEQSASAESSFNEIHTSSTNGFDKTLLLNLNQRLCMHRTSYSSQDKVENKEKDKSGNDDSLPDHIKTVWDYQRNYGGELYTVRYESNLLAELCNSVEDMAVDAVANATQQILKATVFATLLTAVAIPTALYRLANLIDGSWTLAIERSDEAGKELARSLLFSQAGRRPVTLIGYSMGARVIYSCLKELARYQEKWEEYQERLEKNPISTYGNKQASSQQHGFENMREPASILEDVIVMGLPNHLSLRSWYLARQLVAGRLVNCYSKKDLILLLMFRYKKITGGIKRVCGTSAIDVPGMENYDVSDLISGHSQYCIEVGAILKRIGHGQPIRASLNTEPLIIIGSEEDSLS